MSAYVIGPFAQVVTMDGLPPAGPIRDSQLQVIENVGISNENGKIKAIAPMKKLKGIVEEIPYPAVVMPGLVDAHTHLCFAGDRSKDYAQRLEGKTYQEIAKSGGGILHTVNQTREATEEELVALTVARLYEAAQEGVTTCEVKSGYGLCVNSELKMLRAIHSAAKFSDVDVVSTCLAAHTRPPEFKTSKAYLAYIIEELFPIILEEQLTSRIDILWIRQRLTKLML